MLLRILCFLLLLQSTWAQQPEIVLLDSLSMATSERERARISSLIAFELKNDNWERARNYIEIAEEHAKKSASDSVMAAFYKATGDIYSSKDALDIALKNYLKAYDYYKLQPASERFRLENSLAIVYARTKNDEAALKYFRKVLIFQKQQKDTLNLARIYNNMGTLYLEKNIDSSLVYFKRSLQLADTINDENLDVYVHTNLARCYSRNEDEEAAKFHFKKALNSLSQTVSVRAKAWLFNEYSEYYLDQSNSDSSIYFAKKAMLLYDSVAPYSFEHERSVGLLYKALLNIDRYEDASVYFEKYNTIRDTLNLEDKRVNLEKLLIEEEYKAKEKLQSLEEAKKRSKYYIILLSLLAVLLFLGMLLIRFRNKLKRSELEKQLVQAKQKELDTNLELKNKELIGKAMIEIHRTEIIEEILTDLKDIKRKAVKKETQQAIDYIAKRLKRDTTTNLWDEFEVRFEQVHESFYRNLKQKHPDLTPRDKRLCALLKLHLTSKEIAQITGQTSKSVENARTRLRKKLELTHENTDLSLYLSSLE
ncbi:tetratricopeptide repeat protein [Cochleicola gelatinilyticus]|uniref:HTH luxR-type domain-containing protein n=1 Tax=Cochleicola gelatinilyticus TaxID=1763537 RepID=A0A167IIR8_9FLAO|nr:tetratricopeptide repeat protein [Cochleicola gelatinilyticus]OAB79694.1 hypothetical protein ULVI_02805 [Cochleicola gelatinilyticus]